MKRISSIVEHARFDLPAGLVVFLVALPLCLGIGFASGNIGGEALVPPLAGLVTGIVGGLVVAWLSGSHSSVSGPAAGLIVMVQEAVRHFGYEGLLVITVLAGVVQLLFGVLRMGKLGALFPGAVVRGMLVAIGLILILKQIPHAVGFDGDYEGDLTFAQADGRNTLTEIPFALGHMHIGALLVALFGLFLIVYRDKNAFLKSKAWLPGPLLAVVGGIVLNQLFRWFIPSLALSGEFLVALPEGGLGAVSSALGSPNWELIANEAVWISAAGIAVVASLETLLSTEAVDALDPYGRNTPSNRELFAQGAGNVVSGLLGGIPMTAVIVRGSANVASGARTRLSSFFHGVLLLTAVAFGASLINLVPFAALAAILLHIGYKLANPKIFVAMFKRAPDHWVPFVVTVSAILFTDLLKGIALGFVLSVLFITTRGLGTLQREEGHQRFSLGPIIPPLSRFLLRRATLRLSADERLIVDAKDADPIDEDTWATLNELPDLAEKRGATLELRAD